MRAALTAEGERIDCMVQRASCKPACILAEATPETQRKPRTSTNYIAGDAGKTCNSNACSAIGTYWHTMVPPSWSSRFPCLGTAEYCKARSKNGPCRPRPALVHVINRCFQMGLGHYLKTLLACLQVPMICCQCLLDSGPNQKTATGAAGKEIGVLPTTAGTVTC